MYIPFDIQEKKLSYSRIKDLLVSVKTYIDGIVNPRPQTEAMKLGSLFETLLLEPGKFEQLFFIAPLKPEYLSQAKQKKMGFTEFLTVDEQKQIFEDKVKEKAMEKTIITPEMYSRAMNMVNAFNTHYLANKLISQENEYQKKFELSVEGVDIVGYLDIFCKAKEDIHTGDVIIKAGHYYIIDIKKTASVEDSNITKSFRDFKYYIQYYLYKKAIEIYMNQGLIQKPHDQIEIPVFYIFQEDSCPYDTHIVTMDINYEELAKLEIIEAIKRFKFLKEFSDKIYFGINPLVKTLSLKSWQKQEFEESIKSKQIFNETFDQKFMDFMIEKDLDTSCVKPGCSITIENIFNNIAQAKLDKKERSEVKTITDAVQNNIEPDSKKNVAAVVESGSLHELEVPKRKRRTNAEIEADKLKNRPVETIETEQTNIFTSIKTAEIAEITEEKPDYSVDQLIEKGNKLKSFASGLYAVKKAALVLGFFPSMDAVELDKLTKDQRFYIYENLHFFDIGVK